MLAFNLIASSLPWTAAPSAPAPAAAAVDSGSLAVRKISASSRSKVVVVGAGGDMGRDGARRGRGLGCFFLSFPPLSDILMGEINV
jgi:hypothetical protein